MIVMNIFAISVSDTLVIILSIVLIILLTIGIAIGLYVYKVVKQMKHIADSADKAVSNMAEASNFVKNSSQKVSIVKLMNTVAETMKDRASKK